MRRGREKMVCRTSKFPVVDLFTYSKELQDIMLSYYQGIILPQQHQVDSTGEGHLFCFYNLFEPTVRKFLAGVNGGYELRDSYSGNFIDSF